MRDKVHFRWSCSWIDLRGDGRFAKEMIKGDVKKILQRDTRRRLKKELEDELKGSFILLEMRRTNEYSN